MHSLATLQMLALVHGQTTGATTETIALRAELAGMADFAEKLTLVLGAVRRVEKLSAKTTLKAHLVPLQSSGNSLLRGVNRFAAFRAFRVFDWFERHLVYTLKRTFEYFEGRHRKT